VTVPFLDLKPAYEELREELDRATSRAIRSGWYILGPEVDAFERAFADFCGVRHAVGLGNGLDALHLALRAWDVGPGDEVIVPSNTYIATWLAITMVGATPVPVEARLDTCNIDPSRIEAAITERTKAIIAVHLYGQTAEMGPIMSIAEARGLKVLEDAAQAHGARWDGHRAGALGHAAAWSFYPGKNLGGFGDAGGLTTNDDALADRVRVLRNYGSRRKYYNEVLGVNSRLDPIHAAVLAAKLPYLDEWNARRRVLAARYQAAFDSCESLTPPAVAVGCDPVWHLYVVQSPWRDALQTHLKTHGVETLIHYPIPPHRSDAYRSDRWPAGSLPIAERLAETVLSLPIGPHVSTSQQDVVIEAVLGFRPPT